jgi:long-subunit fatty acid transport protein
MKKSGRLFLLVFLFVCATSGVTQVNDAQAWIFLNLEKKITPRLTASFAEEVRLDENYSEVGSLLTDLGVSYRLNDRFKAGALYRFAFKRRLDDTYENRHSWAAEAYYRERLKPLEMVVRLRFQSKYDEAGTSEQSMIPANHLRTKLVLKADLDRKWKPMVFGEAFFRTSHSKYQSLDEYRVGAGLEYTFNRMHKVELNYFISRETGVRNPMTKYIVQFGYSVTF